MSNQNNIRNGIYNTFNSTPEQQQFVRNYSSFQPNSTFYDIRLFRDNIQNLSDKIITKVSQKK